MLKNMSSHNHIDMVSSTIHCTSRSRNYLVKRLLGKGGFARVYEVEDLTSHDKLACKTVPKSMIKGSHKEKLKQEIIIHSKLKHQNICKCLFNFEDDRNYYIMMEVCSQKSLMELQKRRRTISEPECRYFTKQIIEGCIYMHEQQIVHRDLKLGNVFLDDNIVCKIGDFGLAAKLEHPAARKRTLCGTPNYIAPEVLNKVGHSKAVDVWAIGCIIYTLLVGCPPFETSDIRTTYERIKKNEFRVPSSVSAACADLIRKLLHPDQLMRPSMPAILKHGWFGDYIPSSMPLSALQIAPRFDMNASFQAGAAAINRPPLAELGQPHVNPEQPRSSNDRILSDMYHALEKVIKACENRLNELPLDDMDAEYPRGAPILWIGRWVDYSDKYGLGYTLTDNSVGILFNDQTRLLLHSDRRTLQYINKTFVEEFYTSDNFPDHLNKKKTLLDYFKSYMEEHLEVAGRRIVSQEQSIARLPYLRTWFRTRNAMVLQLNSGTLQINFFANHVKLIFDIGIGSVTVLNGSSISHYSFDLLATHRCTRELYERLRYGHMVVARLMTMRSGSTGRCNTRADSAQLHREAKERIRQCGLGEAQ